MILSICVKDMKEVYVKRKSKGVIHPNNLIQNETLGIVLIDEHYSPIARYQFDADRIKYGICYESNDSRIYFSVEPNMISELVPPKKVSFSHRK